MPYKDYEKQKAAVREYQRRQRAERTPKSSTERNRRRNGWKTGAVEEYILRQNNKCMICQEEFTREKLWKTPQADHDHATGKPRALLCGRCNLSLGWYEHYQSTVDEYRRVCRLITRVYI